MASSKCKHSKRKPGKKRMPARWGSYATEVCTTCGAWRIVSHVPGRWTTYPSLEKAIAQAEQEVENDC